MIKKKPTLCVAALGMALALGANIARADKPEWAGKHRQEQRHTHHAEREYRENAAFRFDERDRRIAREYYGERWRHGKCPPGLAKKHNGCRPPGQIRHWHAGERLPREVRYYEVPRELVVRLPAPPPNHRYVQVAGDILMIATGTGMIVDAIGDLSR